MHECVGALENEVFGVKVAGEIMHMLDAVPELGVNQAGECMRMLDAGLVLGVDCTDAVVSIIRREGTVS